MRKLILRSFQSPGDVVMLTAAVRDLHAANPGVFQTDLRTTARELWANNPHVTPLAEGTPGVETLDMHYPLIHQSNTRPYHFIHGYPQYLEEKLGVRVPLTRFQGDIHLSEAERSAPVPGAELGVERPFWILMAGGKYDFTAKWWNPEFYQAVVDHFRGRIQFVQCGEAGHWHPPLEGVIRLVGQTNTREFVRLMYHADGVVCPVTFAMHLAAAVPTPPGRYPQRACVVIAGGREPAQWEAYPHHQYLGTNGALPCCAEGGCWKSRCQTVGDGDAKDRDLCLRPVEVAPRLRIPQCMHMISPADVIRRIELYYDGGALTYRSAAKSAAVALPNGNGHEANGHAPALAPPPAPMVAEPASTPNSGREYAVSFHHGLGDCAYFAHLVPLYTRRGHRIAVECAPDKRFLFEAAGARVLEPGEASAKHEWAYPSGGTHPGQGRFWQGSKMGHNISAPPLPDIGSVAERWDEYVSVELDVVSRLPQSARDTARRWLERLQRPITLFHQKGNTAQARKSIPDAVAARFYERFIDRCDGTLILLDWDRRVPRIASHRVRHLDDLGACSLEVLLAVMAEADLLIGVDSGPSHLARCTNVPTLVFWMPGHYPSTYTLPRRHQANVVLADHTRQWNRFKRIPWNIVEHPGAEFDPDRMAALVADFHAPATYIPEDRGADLQFRQFAREFCRWNGGTSSLAGHWDRNRSFDVLFREATRRFPKPRFVETGTIRSEEDWGGAGFFTYLCAAYAHRRGGRLESVDLSPSNCRFSREWTAIFGDTVAVHERDSLAYLAEATGPFDVVYLDSLDTTEPNHAEHALREAQLAERLVHDRSLIAFDDTPWNAGAFTGKGATAVPYLLERGWKVLYAGYQVVLSREGGTA